MHRVLVVGAAVAASTLTGCTGIGYASCTIDGRCEQTYLTTGGMRYVDPETGITTKGPTIEQLATSSEYRYPVQIDASDVKGISRSEAIAYLQKAVAVADRQYRLCGYASDGVIIAGVNGSIPYEKLRIVPAHGRVLNDDNYVIFARYSPGPSIIFVTVSCIAYRRVISTDADAIDIAGEMRGVTEAFISLQAQLGD